MGIEPSSLQPQPVTAAEGPLRAVKDMIKRIAPGGVQIYDQLKRYTLDARSTMRRARIRELVKAQTGLVVQAGPFAGMRLLDSRSWGDGDLTPKLLGTYEQELQPWLERFMEREYSAVVDIGCAEGYYAVGCARLFPRSRVYAFDADLHAIELTRKNAEANSVVDRLVLGGVCTPERLQQLAEEEENLLVISDCEGYESELFNFATVRALAGSDILIECHDFLRRGCTEALTTAFAGHGVELVLAGGRNLNVFPFLAHLNDAERWEAVCENRARQMHWLVYDSKRN